MGAEKLHVIGVMSGTSLDGVDAVLCEVTKDPLQVRYLDRTHKAFPEKLRKELIQAVQQELKVDRLFLLHHQLGKFYSAILKHWGKSEAQLIGLHGQTVFHQTPDATAQIGEAAYMAQELGLPVVNDFRVNDLAVGGEAAPLAPFFHAVAFRDLAPFTAINLGGIANITVVDGAGNVTSAFDTGPANMLMDALIQGASRKKMDKDGKIAARGKIREDVIRQMLKHPYFRKAPPKSCGREEFGALFYKRFLKAMGKSSLPDRLATAAEITARTLATDLNKHASGSLKNLIFCGGGSMNPFLLKRIALNLAQLTQQNFEVTDSTQHGWHPSAIEGGAFALLAACRIWRIPANVPAATGASRSVLLGKLTELS